MPKLHQNFTLTITPEQFLNNCSPNELKEIDLLIQSNHYVKRMESKTCRICGCTDYDCHQCIEKTGKPCYWAENDLCSACEINSKSIDDGSENT